MIDISTIKESDFNNYDMYYHTLIKCVDLNWQEIIKRSLNETVVEYYNRIKAYMKEGEYLLYIKIQRKKETKVNFSKRDNDLNHFVRKLMIRSLEYRFEKLKRKEGNESVENHYARFIKFESEKDRLIDLREPRFGEDQKDYIKRITKHEGIKKKIIKTMEKNFHDQLKKDDSDDDLEAWKKRAVDNFDTYKEFLYHARRKGSKNNFDKETVEEVIKRIKPFEEALIKIDKKIASNDIEVKETKKLDARDKVEKKKEKEIEEKIEKVYQEKLGITKINIFIIVLIVFSLCGGYIVGGFYGYTFSFYTVFISLIIFGVICLFYNNVFKGAVESVFLVLSFFNIILSSVGLINIRRF